jgi:hypothetical protein
VVDRPLNFYETVRAAVADLAEHGFDSIERVNKWVAAIEAAALRDLIPEATLEARLRETLEAVYRKEIVNGGILKMHPGVGRFTLQNVAPRLHAELDRRMAASRDLIVLNRREAIEKTKRRFRGWASSVPAGGSKAVDRREETEDVRKALRSLPYEERRVAIDQGYKFLSSLSATLASDGGAIAGEWHSHWRQLNYDYREDHKERDLKVYLVRNSWAHKAGFVKPGPSGYLDEITQVGEEVFCRCWMTWFYALSQLPAEMLTKKGAAEIVRVRALMEAA